ncbi:hypothetical protein HYC85_002372 [Camellia sinensis]|uniref:Uncharacterized protein n=1 Tax=Camellia sinensis TaxID=4442 RepID=A0A7J7I812_CAMSI|nr:hypothetical protein HYC85_002372 [Camellia sinensis]
MVCDEQDSEVADHLFLPCPIAFVLWQCLFGLCDDQWVALRDCIEILLVRFKGFGDTKRAKTLWSSIVFAIFWPIWLERNARLFDGKESNVEALWDRVVPLIVDGFVRVTESLVEMMKYVANEPSVGLFSVQQHTQNAVPNVINLKNNVMEKSRELTLHTEDLEDSITMVRPMKDCGFPIADEMIGDIKKSLVIKSTKQPVWLRRRVRRGSDLLFGVFSSSEKSPPRRGHLLGQGGSLKIFEFSNSFLEPSPTQPKRGLIHNPSSGFQMGRTSSWGLSTWGCNADSMWQDGERTGNYLASVLKLAKERASKFKWPQLDPKESIQSKGEKLVSYLNPPLPVSASITNSTLPDAEADELPVSSQIDDELQQELPVDESASNHQLVSFSENYDEFTAEREAKLEEWLGGTDKEDGRHLEELMQEFSSTTL